MTKLKNFNFDKTKIVTKLKLWQNYKPQILTKLKNSNCDINWKLKLWQNSKNWNCDKSKKNWDKNPKPKLWQKSEIKLWQKSTYDKTLERLLVRITRHLNNQWKVIRAAFCNLAMFIFNMNSCHFHNHHHCGFKIRLRIQT